MRSIPQSLLDKIKSAYQTSSNNSNPQMDIIVQQTQQFLGQGMLLNPYTVRVDEVLGPLDIAVRREDPNLPPQGLTMVYIVNGIAKLATINITDHIGKGWVWQYDIAPAIDCAIDYDGKWHRITSFDDAYFHTTSRWALVTYGDPYISLVKPDGSLTVQIGQGEPLTLAPDGVSKCSMLRGWKNTALWNHDHGIIICYIRDGNVMYRNYCQQPDMVSTIWESEQQVAAFDTSVYPANYVSLFRGNDYRTGFCTEINGQMYMTVSARNWATMAIEDHTITVTGTGLSVSLIPITQHDFATDHTISVTAGELGVNFCPIQDPQIVKATTDGASLITLEFDMPLMEGAGQQGAFIVKDTNNVSFAVLSTALGATPYFLELTTASLASAAGNGLTIQFRPIQSEVQMGMLRTQMTPTCIKQLTDFDVVAPLTPPELHTMHTIGVQGTGLMVDLKFITYTSLYSNAQNHTISVTGTGLSVTLIHIDDINP